MHDLYSTGRKQKKGNRTLKWSSALTTFFTELILSQSERPGIDLVTFLHYNQKLIENLLKFALHLFPMIDE